METDQNQSETEMLTISGSFGDPYDSDETPTTPRSSGIISDWGDVNRKLRHHGFQAVMVLPANRIDQAPPGAVFLEEYTSKHLRQTLDSLMADCDRRQALVQELISSSNRMQKDITEHADTVYQYETQIRDLQKKLEEEQVKVQEFQDRRMSELHRHGEEMTELQHIKADFVTRYVQMEQKCLQKESEIGRLQKHCQDLINKEEARLEKQAKMFCHFKRRSPHKHNAIDQKLMDVIESYEAKLSEMGQELEALRKASTEKNSSFIGCHGDVALEQQSSEEMEEETSSEEVALQAQQQRKHPVTSTLIASGGRWRDEDLGPLPAAVSAESRRKVKTLEDKLTSTEKQLRDAVKLIKLLESENSSLKMEIESRPSQEDWKKTKKYYRRLEKILAKNNLSHPRKKHREGRCMLEVEDTRQNKFTFRVEDLHSLPIDVCRDHLKDICDQLQVNDLREIPTKLHSIDTLAQSYPAMEKLIRDILSLTEEQGAPRPSADVMSQSVDTHDVYCERAWQNIMPTLRLWLMELRGLKELRKSVNKLSAHLLPWQPERLFEKDRSSVTVSQLKSAIDSLSLERRSGPADLRGDQPTTEQLQSIVAHFQKLFDVNNVSGVFPRMNEIYMRLGETYNTMNTMKELLNLDSSCKATDVVNAVGKLSKARHLLNVDDLPGIIKRLEEYDEFFPAFQAMVTELCRMLGYDKLKPYGFPVHGAICGYSRRIMWLEVVSSNNDPRVPAKLYLDCVKEAGGCPMLLRTDCGSENGIAAAMQSYFRANGQDELSGERAHRYGTSPANQRIEGWWSFLRRSRTGWWIDFFKDLMATGSLHLGNNYHMECLWFCFSRILQNDLDKVKDHWNSHYIRRSRHDTVPGVPDILYFVPEQSGGTDCLWPVSQAQIDEVEDQCVIETENNIYQEYFEYVIEHQGWDFPTGEDSALRLFHSLVSLYE